MVKISPISYCIMMYPNVLDVECSVGAVSGMVRVTCESNNPLVSPQSCTLESNIQEENFDCMLFF